MVIFFLATLSLLTLHATRVNTALTPCYYQNGTDVTTYFPDNVSYQPCNASAQASMCCRINLGDDVAKDHCRADGLCDSPNHVYLWRESCTDPTWKSPHCQKLCMDYDGEDPWGGSVAGVNSVITQCDDGSYCCGIGTNGSSCCIEGKGVWIVNGKETSINPNSTASASSTSATASSTPLPSAAAVESVSPTSTSAPKASSSKSNTGAIAGGVVGGAAGLALIAGAIYWLLRPRPFKREESEMSRYAQEMATDEKRLVQEMPNATLPHEADGVARIELDGAARQIWKTRDLS